MRIGTGLVSALSLSHDLVQIIGGGHVPAARDPTRIELQTTRGNDSVSAWIPPGLADAWLQKTPQDKYQYGLAQLSQGISVYVFDPIKDAAYDATSQWQPRALPSSRWRIRESAPVTQLGFSWIDASQLFLPAPATSIAWAPTVARDLTSAQTEIQNDIGMLCRQLQVPPPKWQPSALDLVHTLDVSLANQFAPVDSLCCLFINLVAS